MVVAPRICATLRHSRTSPPSARPRAVSQTSSSRYQMLRFPDVKLRNAGYPLDTWDAANLLVLSFHTLHVSESVHSFRIRLRSPLIRSPRLRKCVTLSTLGSVDSETAVRNENMPVCGAQLHQPWLSTSTSIACPTAGPQPGLSSYRSFTLPWVRVRGNYAFLTNHATGTPDNAGSPPCPTMS